MKKLVLPSLHSYRLCLICLVALLLGPASVRAQTFQWAQGLQAGAPFDFNNSVATDAAGNTLYGGIFSNTLQIGSFSLSAPGMNLFVAKLNPAGNVLWAKHFPNDASFEGAVYDLETDPAGNVYVTGSFEDQLIIDNDTLDASASLGPDFFVAQLSAAGAVQWYKHGTGSGNDEAQALRLDGAGNLYLSGYSQGFNMVYDGNVLPGGTNEGFLIKTNPNGQFIWGKRMETNNLDVDVKSNGDGYIAGTFSTSVLDLGNGVTVPYYNPASFETAFVAAFNAAGQFQWAQQLAGPNVEPVRVRATPAGEAVIAGIFTDDLQYGTTTLNAAANSQDLFVLKANATGSLLWSRSMPNFGMNLNLVGFAAGPQLELDAAGNLLIANVHQGPVQLSPTVTHTPVSGSSLEVVVAKYLANGSLAWFLPAGGPATEVLTGLGVSTNGSIVLSGGVSDSAGGTVTTQFGSVALQTTGEGAFLARISNENNRLAGSVFVDLNSSGTRDAGEPGAPYVRLQLQTGQSGFTDATGNFSLFTDTGTYQITIPQPPSYYTVTPGSHSATFTAANQADTTNYFALQPQGSLQDLRVDIAQLNPPRPGFIYRTRITYRNAGTTPMSGTVKVTADTVLRMLTTTPTHTGTSADTLLWSFSGLQPMESRHLLVEWQVPATAPLGDSLFLIAAVTPTAADQNPADNLNRTLAIIQGSFDPNDKLVSHRYLSPAQVQAGQWLTYTLRFQNTGTDTAFTARAADALSPLLDLNTLQVISSSHPFTMRLSDPTTIEWNFGNILLPDSGTNEPASHGYVQYRIKPLSTLSVGDHINTHASIFFDFNAPVMTNTTDTEVRVFTSAAPAIEPQKLLVWPNPATARCLFRLPEKADGPVQLRLINSLGQVVLQETRAASAGSRQQELNVQSFAAGIYLLQVQAGSKLYTSQVVLQR